jgi:hypothetical protein
VSPAAKMLRATAKPAKPPALPKPPKRAPPYEPVRDARDVVEGIDYLIMRALARKLITSADAYALTDQVASRFKRAVASEELMERAERERRKKPAPALGGTAKRKRNEL